MSHEAVGNDAEYALKDFEGTFVGISPTDESAIGLGELEVTVASHGIHSRMATGLEIQEDFIQMDEVREFSPEEIKDELLEEGAEEIPAGMRAFDVAGLQWVFFNTVVAPDAPQLLIRGSMGDMLGPTALFNPTQVEQGLHEQAFSELEIELGETGDLPRLSNGGQASQQS